MRGEPLTMSRQQVAELLGVTVPTVRNWESRGMLTKIQVGRHTAVTTSSVNALVENATDIKRIEHAVEDYKAELEKEQERLRSAIRDLQDKNYLLHNTDGFFSFVRYMVNAFDPHKVGLARRVTVDALYGIPLTEIAKSYDITTDRARLLLNKYLLRLCDPSPVHKLKAENGRYKAENGKLLLEVELLRKRLAENGHKDIDNIFITPITDYELSVRATNCCKVNDIKTIGQLVIKEKDALARCKGFGKRSLREIEELLARYGLRLGMSEEDIANYKP